MTVEVEGADALRPAPVVALIRHASLADSLLSAWVITTAAQLSVRFVLKRELLADPCLDIVGNRLPNCFLDRQAEDSTPGLAQIAALGADMSSSDVAVIFPEGTRANDAKRIRALARIREGDPGRAARLSVLEHLLPPRSSGTKALLSSAPASEVVLGWHTGFDGLDTFKGIIAALGRPRPVRIHFERVPGPPQDPDCFERWLDDVWVRADRAVADSVGRSQLT